MVRLTSFITLSTDQEMRLLTMLLSLTDKSAFLVRSNHSSSSAPIPYPPFLRLSFQDENVS